MCVVRTRCSQAEFHRLSTVEAAFTFADPLSAQPELLLEDTDLLEEFVVFGVSVLRQQYLFSHRGMALVPPPTQPGATKQEAAAHEGEAQMQAELEAVERPFMYELLLTTGEVCGRRFTIRAQMRQHRRHRPHGRILFSRFVKSTVFPWCSTARSSRGVAMSPVRAASQRGHCLVDTGGAAAPPG